MNIIVFGGCGFVGSNLCLYFKEKGHNVTAFDNLVRRGSEFNLPEFKKKGIKFIHGDIRNVEDFPVQGYDVICECSAQPSATDGYDNPYFDFSSNTIGLINVLEKARKDNSVLIFWSTNKTMSGDMVNALHFAETDTRYIWERDKYNYQLYPKGFDPDFGISDKFDIDGGQHSIYGLSKIMSDLACQEYYDAFGTQTVINRFSCLAGPRQWGKCAQGWVAWFAIANQFELPIKYIGWKGKQVRDVLFIDDICRLVELEIENIEKTAGNVYTIGGGMKNTLSLIEAVAKIEELTGKKFVKIDYEETPRKADHRIYVSDTRKIYKDIHWKPEIGIDEGYQRIIDWVKSEPKLKELYENKDNN